MTILSTVLAVILFGPAVQSPLDGDASIFAEAWALKDARHLQEVMAADGIRLHLPEEKHQTLQPRQARAAIESFLQKYSGGSTQVTRVSTTGGDQGLGFAEIQWETGSPGVSVPVIFTVFVGYALDGQSWHVTEIRVLFR